MSGEPPELHTLDPTGRFSERAELFGQQTRAQDVQRRHVAKV